MRRVLLTGAAGFLGAHMLRAIMLHTDWTVACPVTFRHKGLPQRIVWAMDDPWLAKDWARVDVVRCDLAAPISPMTADQFGDVDTVLNFAADTHPPRSVFQPVQFVHNNVDITLHLLEYARLLTSLTAFIQFSTDAVYGPVAPGKDPHREWAATNPANPYAASKAMQEALAMAWWRSYQLPVAVVALMNPMGETQAGEKFIPSTVGKVLRGEPVQIHCDAEGNPGARTYIDAADVTDAVMFLLNEHPPWKIGTPGVDRLDRWNVVGPREIDNVTVVDTIAEALGEPVTKVLMKVVDRPEHGHRYAMSGDLLASVGWTPGLDTVSSIRRVAVWTAEHPEWLRA